MPDNPFAANNAIGVAQKLGFEVYGLGIRDEHITHLLPHTSRVVNDLPDLVPAMEWADATTNTAVGCSHCSPGCDHCYAEKFAHRLSKNPVATKVYAGVVDERGKWTGKINSNFSEKMYPHRVPGKGKRVFVGSMTDIFHPNYPADNRDELFASIMMM